MDLRRLGNRLRDQRSARKLRQADIASALGVSVQAVSKWERGENAPDISLLVELGRLLGVSVEWILGGSSAERDTFPAAVLCTSLNCFAERSVDLSPREPAGWVNGIYYAATEALLEVEGVPIKYVGDGLLGFVTGTDCRGRALDAATNAKKRLGIPEFVAVVHHGDVFLGSIGHPDYRSPDVLGETVNTAFMVMPWVAAHTETGIGLTDSVRDSLSSDVELVERGNVSVPGRTSPVTIYERKELE